MTTIRIKLPKIEEVEINLWVANEDIPVKGNAIDSGNARTDKRIEDTIKLRMNNGDIWAWCHVYVAASWKGLEGTDHIGCCSYKDEKDFKETGGCYDDMRLNAYDDLIEQIKALKG